MLQRIAFISRKSLAHSMGSIEVQVSNVGRVAVILSINYIDCSIRSLSLLAACIEINHLFGSYFKMIQLINNDIVFRKQCSKSPRFRSTTKHVLQPTESNKQLNQNSAPTNSNKLSNSLQSRSSFGGVRTLNECESAELN